jgi:hypothetical protein
MATSEAKKAALKRVTDLETAFNEYVSREKTRINNEAKVLQAILDGRTGGAGIERFSIQAIETATKSSIHDLLVG